MSREATKGRIASLAHHAKALAQRVVRENLHKRGAAVRSAAAFAVEALESRELLTAYFVSTTGNDANSGVNLSVPFKTIQRAANVARPGDTVLIRGGTYRETVTPANSGTGGAPITFQNYNGEKVTISGTDVVRNWGLNGGKVYKAGMGWSLGNGRDQVFVDGKMMTEARFPNTTLDVSRPTKGVGDAGSSMGSSGTLYDSDIKFGADYLKGANIHMLTASQWVAQTGTVTGSNYGRLSYSLSTATPPVNGGGGAPKYYVWGKFKFLDAANEWYRDPSNGQLYLWSPQSDNPSNHLVEAKRRENAFVLTNRSHINIKGLNLFASTIKAGWSHNVTVDSVRAHYVSHTTLINNIWGEGNQTTGIMLIGNNNVIRNSEVAFSSGNGITINGSNNLAQNNVVHDVGYSSSDNAAVWTNGYNARVLNNTLYNTARGIVKHNNSPAAKIMYNHMFDGSLQTHDAGATYTYGHDGRGTQIAYNVIRNMHSGGVGAMGIYLDRGSNNYVVHHNVVFDTDAAICMTDISRNNKVYNNTLIGKKAMGQWRTLDFAGTQFKNNIFVGSTKIGSGASASNNLNTTLSGAGFANYSGKDFALTSWSPAINKGAYISGITTNTVGAPDLGAFEHGKGKWGIGANVSSSTAVFSGGTSGGTTTAPPPPASPAPSTAGSKLSGTVIGTTGSYMNAGNVRNKAFDGNLGSYFDGPVANGNWVGLDLGSAKTITSIRYAPRSGGFEVRMVGGRFQASNSATFSSGVVDLFTVTAKPAGNQLTTRAVNNTNGFRYVRYLSPTGSYGAIAEMQVFGLSR
ncbi:MAG TPA: discoidin domain-containing protein [Tepidisphaeraceae bacterium]|nr:discoidin domain-containing protein [Tepidisphaeraceae bacterium]